MEYNETNCANFLQEYLKLCVKYGMRVESDAHHVCNIVCDLTKSLNIIKYTISRDGGCLFHFSTKDNGVWHGANLIELEASNECKD